ncbi:MAG: hypothetical protein LUC32_00475 [Clostridiales bacterium]|nr:hypothetical protein [Clostridiales bacterium]
MRKAIAGEVQEIQILLIKSKAKLCMAALLAAAAVTLSGCDGLEEQISGYFESAAPELSESQQSAPEETEESEQPAVESVSEERYAYQTLDDEEKAVYDEIVYALLNREEERQISTTDAGVMSRAYQAIRCDYCNIFWLEQLEYVTNSRGGEVVSIEITPVYSMTEEKQDVLQAQIDAEAARMLEGVPADGSDFDKVLYVYETLIREVDYVVDSEDNQNIISVLVNHETICQGYAYATQYLLEQLGIPCTTVTGMANGEKHAWNLVFMDGAYYYLDTTWGNSRYVTLSGDETESAEESASAVDYINYDYFCVTTEMLLTTHEPDEEISLPDCTATEDNYFIHEGLYIDVWDPDRIGGIIREGYESGQQAVQIRFANAELCGEVMRFFVEEGRLFDYCSGLTSAQYFENADSAVLVILFS